MVFQDHASQYLPAPVDCTENFSLISKIHHDSPSTPIESNSASAHSVVSGSAGISEEINSGEDNTVHAGET